MSAQLNMFGDKTSQELTSSLSEALAKTLVWLENVKGWEDNAQALSLRQYDSSANPDHEFLCGKMLREHSPAMMAKILRQSSKPLPISGAIDLNGNCLILRTTSPKIGNEFILSDILQRPEEVGAEYFQFKKLEDLEIEMNHEPEHRSK